MKAAVLTEFGSASRFKFMERPIPKAKPGWSVLKIKAFGLNRAELYTRLGQSPDVTLPRVLGIEAVGTIYETLDSNLPIGAQVMTMMGGLGRQFDGSYEDYVLVPNAQLYPLQLKRSWAELATIPESGYTAFGSIKVAKVKRGQSVLVRGGTSTVGLATIAFLKQLGVTVTATSRRSVNADALVKMGVDHFVLDQEGILQTQHQYDAIIDYVGAKVLHDSLKHLSHAGVMVVTGGLADAWQVDNFSPFEIPFGAYLTNFQSTQVNKELIAEMITLIKRANIHFKVGQRFQLNELNQAHEVLASGRILGKLVVVL